MLLLEATQVFALSFCWSQPGSACSCVSIGVNTGFSLAFFLESTRVSFFIFLLESTPVFVSCVCSFLFVFLDFCWSQPGSAFSVLLFGVNTGFGPAFFLESTRVSFFIFC